jgi:hypothetical protein
MNVPNGAEYDPTAPYNERLQNMRVCWNCEGTRKEVNLVPIKGLINSFKEEEVDCSLCDGTGEIPNDNNFFD